MRTRLRLQRLIVNVAGEPVTIQANPDKLLWVVMNQAFGAAGRTGEPWENWELRDDDGRLLDIEIKVRDFGWVPDTLLFLNMKAAIGG